MNSILYQALGILFTVIEFAILARVLITWFPVPKENYLVRMLYQITEPILAPVRNIIQRSAMGKNMMFDFSPVIAFLLIGLIRNIVLSFLR
jgi:YggT family protein